MNFTRFYDGLTAYAKRSSARCGLALIVGLVLWSSIGSAQPFRRTSPNQDDIQRLIAQQRRLDAVIYRLSVAAASKCPAPASSPAFGILAADEFTDPQLSALVTDELQSPGLTVVSYAGDGPADRAGLRQGDQIIEMKGFSLTKDTSPLTAKHSGSQAMALRLFLQKLGSDIPIEFTVQRQQDRLAMIVPPSRGCAIFGLVTTATQPMASQSHGQIKISLPLLELAANDDELAFIVGHELAHYLLDQDVRPATGRQIELLADREGSEIARDAGYEIAHVPDFLERLQGQLPIQAAFQLSHPGFRTRSKALRAWIQSRSLVLTPPAH